MKKGEIYIDGDGDLCYVVSTKTGELAVVSVWVSPSDYVKAEILSNTEGLTLTHEADGTPALKYHDGDVWLFDGTTPRIIHKVWSSGEPPEVSSVDFFAGGSVEASQFHRLTEKIWPRS